MLEVIHMNKTQLVKRMSNDTGLSQATAGTALQSVLDAITETIQDGEKVLLVGFGTFSVAERSAREGRNPSTGKKIKIPARKAVKFKAGKKFTDSIN
jgi:DNA-binding protein HU-beta